MKTKEERITAVKCAAFDMLYTTDYDTCEHQSLWSKGCLDMAAKIIRDIEDEEDQPEIQSIKPETFDLNGKTWTLNLDIDKDKWRHITGEAEIKAQQKEVSE